MVNKVVVDAEERMKKILEATRREFAGIRSGKATPALLVIQPWDKSLVKTVSRAIQQSDLGLNPTDDGAVVRVPIPALTEERRRDLVKLIAKLAEEGRVHVRQVRHDANKELKAEEHDGKISEDDAKRLVSEVQKLTDRYVAMIDELLKKKTAEVLEV